MKKRVDVKKLFLSILPGLAVAFAGCFMLFFYAPYELYLTNSLEFWFSPVQMLPMTALMFIGSFVLVALLMAFARIINQKFYIGISAVGLIAVVCSYIQGNFMVKNLPSLNGAGVDWAAYPEERIKTVILWLAVAAVVLLLLKILGQKRFNVAAGFFGLGLSLMLLLTVGTLFFAAGKHVQDKSLIATDKNQYTVSQDENFLVIILDAVDACAFEELLFSGKGYEEVFKDFTYYDNTMGAYPYSLCSEGMYLTGQWYEGEESYQEYIRRSIEKCTIYDELDSAGYTKGLYMADGAVLAGLPEGMFENLSTNKPGVDSNAYMAKILLKMSIIKYAPWDLKVYGYDLYGRVNGNRVYIGEKGVDYFSEKNTNVYERVKDSNPFVVAEGRYAKIIHLEGAHEPHVYDAQLNISEDATYRTCIEGAMMMFSKYLERLQEAGAYDCSSIIVMADHGLANPNDEVLDTMQQHPILLIKGRNEVNDKLTVNNAPISTVDLQQAYSRLLEGSSGQDVFDWQAGDYRERRFLFYDINTAKNFREYIQTGQAEDMETLLPTGRVYAPVG